MHRVVVVAVVVVVAESSSSAALLVELRTDDGPNYRRFSSPPVSMTRQVVVLIGHSEPGHVSRQPARHHAHTATGWRWPVIDFLAGWPAGCAIYGRTGSSKSARPGPRPPGSKTRAVQGWGGSTHARRPLVSKVGDADTTRTLLSLQLGIYGFLGIYSQSQRPLKRDT